VLANRFRPRWRSARADVLLPFGGVKHTGNGHREGLGTLDFSATWKAVYVD